LSEKTLTRADLVEAVVSNVGLPRQEAAELVETVLQEISTTLARGEAVKLSSFGSFGIREKRERIGRNPKTGEEVPITPRRVLVFRASNIMKKRIDGDIKKKKARSAPRAKVSAKAKAKPKVKAEARPKASAKPEAKTGPKAKTASKATASAKAETTASARAKAPARTAAKSKAAPAAKKARVAASPANIKVVAKTPVKAKKTTRAAKASKAKK